MSRAHAVPTGSALARGPQRPVVPSDEELERAAAPRRPVPPARAEQPPAEPESVATEPPAEPSGQPPSEIATEIATEPVSEELPPPPALERAVRTQFNTKLLLGLQERTRAFVALHNSSLQGVLEAALAEYMDRRGYTEAVHRRGARRRS